MTSRFAHQYEHLQTLQSSIRTAKSDIHSLINECPSILSFSGYDSMRVVLMKALNTLDDTIHGYITAVAKVRCQVENMLSDNVDKETELKLFHEMTDDKDDDLDFYEESLTGSLFPRIQSTVNRVLSEVLFDVTRWTEMIAKKDSTAASIPIQSSKFISPHDIQSIQSVSTCTFQSTLDSNPITMSGSIVENSIPNETGPIHTVTDPRPVWQTTEISPTPVSSQLNPSMTGIPPLTNALMLNYISVNGNDNSIDSSSKAYHSNNLKPIPIPGTSPKKKPLQYFAMAQMPPSIHHLPRSMPYARRSNHRPFQARREGSRPNSIFNPSIHSFRESIAATKHPPNSLHNVSASTHNPNSDADCLRRDRTVNNYKHLHDEPWPDDRNPSFNCIIVCPPPFLLYPVIVHRRRPSSHQRRRAVFQSSIIPLHTINPSNPFIPNPFRILHFNIQ